MEVKKRAQSFILAQYPQIFQRPAAAGEHQKQRQDMRRRAIAHGAPRARQFMVNQTAYPHRLQIFAKQRQPTLRRHDFLRRRKLERQYRLHHPHRTLQVISHHPLMPAILLKKRAFSRTQIIHSGFVSAQPGRGVIGSDAVVTAFLMAV